MRIIVLYSIVFQLFLFGSNYEHDALVLEKQLQLQSLIDEQLENDIIWDQIIPFRQKHSLNEEERIAQRFKKAFLPKTDSTKQSKTLYISYRKVPEFVFPHQRFSVSLELQVATDKFDRLETRFLNQQGVDIINPLSQWRFEKRNGFVNQYYFKLQNESFVMPDLQIVLYRYGEIIEIVELPSKEISLKRISPDNKQFSNVIAKDFSVVNSQTKQYSNKELLVILEMKSLEGNLEDFNLSFFKDQSLLSFEEEDARQTVLYSVIIPVYTKQLVFEYYNTLENRFIKFELPVVVTNDLISTQTDVNPNNNNLLLYKKIFLGIFVFILLVLYSFFKRFYLLIFSLLGLIAWILYMMPHKIINVKQGASIYILPTHQSTVFYYTQRKRTVEMLKQRGSFVKISFLDKMHQERIGWIKESDIVKN